MNRTLIALLLVIAILMLTSLACGDDFDRSGYEATAVSSELTMEVLDSISIRATVAAMPEAP